MIFDPLWLILIGPVMVLALWAQIRTKSTFTKFSKVPAAIGLSGAQVARRLLDADNLRDVQIEAIGGSMQIFSRQ